MNRHDGYFWLGIAPYWLRIVTAIGTIATALPGLKRIDSVMISGSADWSGHGPDLMVGLAYLAGAGLLLVAGLVLGDLLRLLQRWQAQQLTRHEIVVSSRPEPEAPLPSSRALLESLGLTPPQAQPVTVSRSAQRHS